MTRKPYNRYYPQSSLKKGEMTNKETDTESSLYPGLKSIYELYDVYNVTNIDDLKAAIKQGHKALKEEIAKEKAEEKAEEQIKKIAERAAVNIVKSRNKR